MLLIQKGKPTRKYCDRCHQRSRGELCENCRPPGELTEKEWLELGRETNAAAKRMLAQRRKA